MAKTATEERFPRQLAVTMDPVHWRALRLLERQTTISPGANARRALHEFLMRECPAFRAEIEAEDTQRTSWILNDGD